MGPGVTVGCDGALGVGLLASLVQQKSLHILTSTVANFSSLLEDGASLLVELQLVYPLAYLGERRHGIGNAFRLVARLHVEVISNLEVRSVCLPRNLLTVPVLAHRHLGVSSEGHRGTDDGNGALA